MVGLATTQLYKEVFKLEPGYVQILTGIIVLPWSFKVFYGLISDNFTLFGSKRRSYLVIISAV